MLLVFSVFSGDYSIIIGDLQNCIPRYQHMYLYPCMYTGSYRYGVHKYRDGQLCVYTVLVCLRKKSTEADPKACFETGVVKGY